MAGVPPIRDGDSEDVVWALQTADALWKREERRDAVVWLRRAAQAASDAEDDERAVGLARDAADLADYVARHADAPAAGATSDALATPSAMQPPASFVGADRVLSFDETRGRSALEDTPEIDLAAVEEVSAEIVLGESSSDLGADETEEVTSRHEPEERSQAPAVAPRSQAPAVAPHSQAPAVAPRSPVRPVRLTPLVPTLRAPPRLNTLPPPAPSFGAPLAPPAVPSFSEAAAPSPTIVFEGPETPSLATPSSAPVAPARLTIGPRAASRRTSTPAATSFETPAPRTLAPAAPDMVTPAVPTASPPSAPGPMAAAGPDAATPSVPVASAPSAPGPIASPAPLPLTPSAPSPSMRAPPGTTALGAPLVSIIPPAASMRAHVPTGAEAHAGMLDPWDDSKTPSGIGRAPPAVPRRSLAPTSPPPEPEEVFTSAPPPAAVPKAVTPAPSRPRTPAPRADGPPSHELPPWLASGPAREWPDAVRAALAASARIHDLAKDDEVFGFALAIVVEGGVDVAPTIVDAPAERLDAGAVLRARGTLASVAPVRLIGRTDRARVVTWREPQVADAFQAYASIDDALRVAANRVQALVGVTLGPLGERLDPNLRAEITRRLRLRVVAENEVVVQAGQPVPGLFVVGTGEIELSARLGAPGRTVLRSGEFLFPSQVLMASPAPSSVRGAKGGALLLVADRALTQELLVTCPPLLEILAAI